MEYEPKHIPTEQGNVKTPIKWTDIIFDEMVKKSKGNHKEGLLHYRFGTNKSRNVAKVAVSTISGAAGGAAAGSLGGGLLGIAGGPVGVGLGVDSCHMVGGVAAGIAGGVAAIEQVMKE